MRGQKGKRQRVMRRKGKMRPTDDGAVKKIKLRNWRCNKHLFKLKKSSKQIQLHPISLQLCEKDNLSRHTEILYKPATNELADFLKEDTRVHDLSMFVGKPFHKLSFHQYVYVTMKP